MDHRAYITPFQCGSSRWWKALRCGVSWA